eukprot:CAMPEP_0204840726 /NCGR_PEP_ID=MMETSP1346-20131115/38785_1 /ASSEMBLY_ACC=CAM_ASM_000771 /TAXON_ID=215587 /ORGANISM="Aplanochytrium stocchinoi, Strain GSBS06" /LENGTH=489 /DNA_ID=CAMNT_0051978321 /DNA_START=192 /DNA_END=1661 /DNA_ORIENTATION=+
MACNHQNAVNVGGDQQQFQHAQVHAQALQAALMAQQQQQLLMLQQQLYPVKNLQQQTAIPGGTAEKMKMNNTNPSFLSRVKQETEEKTEEKQSEAESGRTAARLARNRTTARLRRERKKQQAETLTKQVAELTFKLEALEGHLETLGPKAKKNILKGIESFGSAPVACVFCNQDFPKKEMLDKHVETHHAAELKARKMTEQQQKEEQNMEFDEQETDDQNLPLGGSRRASINDSRRKRRLERNAQSARLCRQRKKQYIESLRIRLPELRHRVEILRKLIPDADTILERKKAQVSNANVSVTPPLAELEKQLKNKKQPSEGENIGLTSSPIRSISLTFQPSGDTKVNIPRLSGWECSSRRGNPKSSGYESSGSNGSHGSSKHKSRIESKENNRGTSKRRRGSTSVDISSGSPSPISTMTSFGMSPTPFTLSSPLLSANAKAGLPFILGQQAKPAVVAGPKTTGKNSSHDDVYQAAFALSNLGPLAHPASK